MAAEESRRGAFPTTHASLVELAARRDAPGWRAAWERFFAAYWQPLYAYLRRTGSSSPDALDLLQEFFLAGAEGDLLARFDPARGRLRTYLLTCLTNHRRKARRREGARPERRYAWQGDGAPREPAARDPDAAFEEEWTRCVRERAVSAVEERLEAEGDALALRVLREWVLRPSRPPAADVAAALGLSPGALYTRASRLRSALVDEVERSVRWFEAQPEALARERDAVLRLLREASA